VPETTTATVATFPRCTYRLQLRSGVGFAEAEALVPYVARLGASHLYLAPPFTARAGSTHGYDVADATALDPALGGREGFERMARAARAAGLGVIIDIVPNHMGIGPGNPWWVDVLRHGRGSRFAGHFDIDFDRDPDGKLVLPTLGAPLEEVLAKGELELKDGGKELALYYYDAPFPLAPGSARASAPAGTTRRRRAGCWTRNITASPSGARASAATTAASSTSARSRACGSSWPTCSRPATR
jgi:maltooligosyltrehalose synthase